MAALDFHNFSLHNRNKADTIIPLVFDQSGSTVIWDGSIDSGNTVGPGEYRRFASAGFV